MLDYPNQNHQKGTDPENPSEGIQQYGINSRQPERFDCEAVYRPVDSNPSCQKQTVDSN